MMGDVVATSVALVLFERLKKINAESLSRRENHIKLCALCASALNPLYLCIDHSVFSKEIKP